MHSLIIYSFHFSILLLMASQISLSSSILLLILFHILSVIDPTCRASTSIPTRHKQTGFRSTLTRANLPKNRYFLNEFSPPSPGLTFTLTANGDEYTVNLNIGTPPVAFKAVIDTGSDHTWTKCKSNGPSFFSTRETTSFSSISSSTTTSFSSTSSSKTTSSSSRQISYSALNRYKYLYPSSPPQNTSSFLFDPLKSQSFSQVTEPCESFQLPRDCKMRYADKTVIRLIMAHETLTMTTTHLSESIGLTLACGIPESDGFGYDGILGMGRGKVSFLSQLNERVFAYCLPSRFGDESKNGVFLTGSEARSIAIGDNMTQTMPLLSNSKLEGYDSLYRVSLEGISVGETRLNVTKSDLALTDGSGGMVVDSGATFTYLEDRVVGMIKDEFLKQTKLEKSEAYKAPYDDLDLCFMSKDLALIVLPKIVFHFEGADWEMSRENYIYEDRSQPDQACFAILAYGEDKTSVLGNMQQQNKMMVFDLESNTLSFKPAKCNEL